MIKILGVLFIVFGCGGIGFLLVRSYRKEVECLQQLTQCLQWMICELNYRMPPLSTLFRGAAEGCKGPISQVFNRFSRELDQQFTPHVSICMNVTLDSFSDLPVKTYHHLRQLGTSLGHFDLQGQVSALEASLTLCQQDLQQLQLKKDEKVRNYQTLSLCAGVALALILT